MNYPWINYGQDFGCGPWGNFGVSTPEIYSTVSADFASIRDCGAAVVRWFLFGVGNSGIVSSAGIPRVPDQFLFRDVAAALALARQNNLRLCLSLIDYLWLQAQPPATSALPNNKILQFAAGREAFLENILIPLFREFRQHPALFAWEIANEPEWAIPEFARSPEATMPLKNFRTFAAEIAQAIREFADVSSTLGSARLLWLPAWSSLGLALHQAHYYPSLESAAPADLVTQLAVLPPLDAPLWLGELPFHDPAFPNYSFQSALHTCRAAGISGAALWRWRKPEPTESDFALGSINPQQLQSWLAQNPNPRA